MAKKATETAPVVVPSPRFKPAVAAKKRRLVMSVEGLEGSGKTHFSLTAPGPLALQNFDIGVEGVVDKFLDKPISIADYRLMIPALGRDERESEVIKEAVVMRADFEADYRAALQSQRTVVWDTGSEAWALYRMACFGRVAKVPPARYEEVNTQFRELIRLAFESDCNLVMLHKLKAVWENNEKTGRMERQGFADIGYLAQVCLRAETTPRETGGVDFSMTVTKCRPNPDLLGFVFSNPTFADVACLIYPDTEEGDWQ